MGGFHFFSCGIHATAPANHVLANGPVFRWQRGYGAFTFAGADLEAR